MKRALILCALLTAALAPVAQARPSLVVTATAKGSFGGFERMDVRFECAAVDVTAAPAWLTRCSFGPLYANTTGQCMDCPIPSPPAGAAVGSGNVRLGLPYDLCVTATSLISSGPQTVTRCAPYSYLTNTAVIAG